MKRYMPTFTQAPDSAEQWAGMTEDDDGDWYSRADADSRISDLERALKSASHVLKLMLEKHESLAVIGHQALTEADRALSITG
jgi:hypothetical protein